MQFASFQEFVYMDGHGPYVWAAYGITLAVMAGLVLGAMRRRRQLFLELRARIRREERDRQRSAQ